MTWPMPHVCLTRATHDRIFCATIVASATRVELLQAPVAGAAVVRRVRLAEILDERPVAAARAGGVALHVAQQRPRARRSSSPFCSSICRQRTKSRARIDQHALGRQAVAAGAARLLLVVLERSRRAGVHDEAHVRSIDAHAERDGGDDDVGALVEERLLVPAAHVVRQAGVIRQRAQPLLLAATRPALRPRGATSSR